MPSGSDFVCTNPSCAHYNEGFSMHDFWPLAKIDDILASSRAKDNKFPEGYLDGLKDRKKEGRDVVCAPFPRCEDIKPCGIRVQLYCDKPPMVVDQDIICEVPDGSAFAKIAAENGIAKSCEPCQSTLRTFRQAFASGIKCPHCSVRMEGRVWYTSGG
jgi:hypothetical protein